MSKFIHGQQVKPRALRVRANDELVLDAGRCIEVAGARGPERIIRRPATTLFRQLLAYLKSKPDPAEPGLLASAELEGIATAAVTLRWGSYLAVLMDHDKPEWSHARSEARSRVSDSEMACINIEASAALTEWIDISREDRRLYQALVDRALHYLPMPHWLAVDAHARIRTRRHLAPFLDVADPEIGPGLVRMSDPARVAAVRRDAIRQPSRLLANAIVNAAWRNGPVEAIHGGQAGELPLNRRRVTLDEEQDLMRFSSERLALGMRVVDRLAAERGGRPWPERVLPYGLAERWGVTPSRWSLTEVSRAVQLPAT